MPVPGESAGMGRVCSGAAEGASLTLVQGKGQQERGGSWEIRNIMERQNGGETCVSSPDSPLLPQTQISLFRLLSLRIWLSTNV